MGSLDKDTLDKIIGVSLIVLGALALFARMFSGLIWLAAVAAIIVGVLMLMGTLKGSQPMAIGLIAVGAIMVIPNALGSAVSDIINIILGVLLLVLGIAKLMGKW